MRSGELKKNQSQGGTGDVSVGYAFYKVLAIGLRLFTLVVMIPEVKGALVAMGVDFFFHTLFLLQAICMGSGTKPKPVTTAEEKDKKDK